MIDDLHDVFGDHEDEDRDLLTERHVLFGKTNKVIMRRRNPFGYWYLSLERGQVRPQYTGAYTTIEAATTAAERLVNEYRTENKLDRPKVKYRKTPRKVKPDGETATNID